LSGLSLEETILCQNGLLARTGIRADRNSTKTCTKIPARLRFRRMITI
jgi:hypothetical protein